jgi:hypothetical protein
VDPRHPDRVVCTMVATLILQKVFRPERGPARA